MQVNNKSRVIVKADVNELHDNCKEHPRILLKPHYLYINLMRWKEGKYCIVSSAKLGAILLRRKSP